jgi:hypothetical protein
MTRNACLGPAAIGLLLFCTVPAHAEDAATSPQTAAISGAAAEPVPMEDDDLGNFRGGQAITIANQNMTSIMSGSNIDGNVSAGAVSLTDNALSSFNGLGNIVINTGSQVSVQSGMNVVLNVGQ